MKVRNNLKNKLTKKKNIEHYLLSLYFYYLVIKSGYVNFIYNLNNLKNFIKLNMYFINLF